MTLLATLILTLAIVVFGVTILKTARAARRQRVDLDEIRRLRQQGLATQHHSA